MTSTARRLPRHILSGPFDVYRDEHGVLTIRHHNELGTDRLILSTPDGILLAELITELTSGVVT